MKAVEPSASSAMAKKAQQSRKTPATSGKRSPHSPAASSVPVMAKNASDMILRAPKRLPALPQKIAVNSSALPAETSRPPASSPSPGHHHEHRPIDEEGRPEAGAAEGDQPGEPQPRLGDEAADIGERIGRPGLAGPDQLVVAEPVVPEQRQQHAAEER